MLEPIANYDLSGGDCLEEGAEAVERCFGDRTRATWLPQHLLNGRRPAAFREGFRRGSLAELNLSNAARGGPSAQVANE